MKSAIHPSTESLHKLDRAHYDTPGSIRECACADCNRVRRLYGCAPKRWKYSDRINYETGAFWQYRTAR